MLETAKPITLHSLLYGFIQLTREKWPNTTFPIWFSPVWHRFFYDLKKKLGSKFPEVEQAVGFIEWDAPHPYIPELGDLLRFANTFEAFWINEHQRMYPTRTFRHNLPPSLFEEMLAIAQTREGLLENAG